MDGHGWTQMDADGHVQTRTNYQYNDNSPILMEEAETHPSLKLTQITLSQGKLSSQPRDSTWDPNNEEIDRHSEQPTSWSNNHIDEESTNDQPNIDHELMQLTPRPNNRSGTKHALSKAWTELSAKTAILEWLYVD
ncbi:hypothetical protein M422DRAFT_242799 [Sphaerobolus stellatus SS14]|nr:hypothetical protein M422DRAFT_242799 [Sphaerobolus stellatus SS14]